MTFYEISAFVDTSKDLPMSVFSINGTNYEEVKEKALKTALCAYPEEKIFFDVYYRAKTGKNDYRTLRAWYGKRTL